MLDHTYKGTPVARMSLEDIYSCLNNGFYITGRDPKVQTIGPDADAIRLRLEIELVRRSLGLPIRGIDNG